tara:strand:+ start:921 stop:2726 length:1806 start_codon:yes stop_codon:yes gene_type:complete
MAEKYDFFKIRSDVKKIKDNGGTIDAVKLYLSRNGMTLDEFVTRNKSLGRKSLSNIARTGIGQGLMFGFGDEATAGIKALFGGDYDKALNKERQIIETFRDVSPKTAIGTEIGGAVVPTVAGLLAGALASPFTGGASGVATTAGATARLAPLIAKLTGKAGSLRRGTTVGAGQGTLYGAGTATGDLQDRAEGAGGGALLGAPLGATSTFIGKNIIPSAFEGTKRRLSDLGLLRKEGVDLTLGQKAGNVFRRMEDVATSVPIFGDLIKNAKAIQTDQFNRAVYNRVLSPIGGKLDDDIEIGSDALKQVNNKISEYYKKVHVGLTLDQNSVTKMLDDFDTILLKASEDADLTDAMLQEAEKQINGKIKRRIINGEMSGVKIQEAQSALKAKIRDLARSTDDSARDLFNVLIKVNKAFDDILINANPSKASQKKAVDKAFSLNLIATKAKVNAGDNELFTPAQFSRAIKQSDLSRFSQTFAKGEAPMQDLSGAGVRQLSGTIPESGTAYRSTMTNAILGNTAVGGAGYAGGALSGLYDPNLALYAMGGIPLMSAYTKSGMRNINRFSPNANSRFNLVNLPRGTENIARTGLLRGAMIPATPYQE